MQSASRFCFGLLSSAIVVCFGACASVPNPHPCTGQSGTACGERLFEEPPLRAVLEENDEVYRCWLDNGWGMTHMVRVEKQGAEQTATHKNYIGAAQDTQPTVLSEPYVATAASLSDDQWQQILERASVLGSWDVESPEATGRRHGEACPVYTMELGRGEEIRQTVVSCPTAEHPVRLCDILFDMVGFQSGY